MTDGLVEKALEFGARDENAVRAAQPFDFSSIELAVPPSGGPVEERRKLLRREGYTVAAEQRVEVSGGWFFGVEMRGLARHGGGTLRTEAKGRILQIVSLFAGEFGI